MVDIYYWHLATYKPKGVTKVARKFAARTTTEARALATTYGEGWGLGEPVTITRKERA